MTSADADTEPTGAADDATAAPADFAQVAFDRFKRGAGLTNSSWSAALLDDGRVHVTSAGLLGVPCYAVGGLRLATDFSSSIDAQLVLVRPPWLVQSVTASIPSLRQLSFDRSLSLSHSLNLSASAAEVTWLALDEALDARFTKLYADHRRLVDLATTKG